jgi:ABC-type phosphate transport system substrate-binding protein
MRLARWRAPTSFGRLCRWCLPVCHLALLLAVVHAGRAPAASPAKLAVIVNPQLSVTGLGGPELAAIFTRATRRWQDGTTVRPLNLLPGTSERVEFDRVVLSMSPEQSAQYWVDKQVRGEEAAPKAIAQAEIVVRLVATLSGAIGYVPEDKVDASVRVVARIRGGRLAGP